MACLALEVGMWADRADNVQLRNRNFHELACTRTADLAWISTSYWTLCLTKSHMFSSLLTRHRRTILW